MIMSNPKFGSDFLNVCHIQYGSSNTHEHVRVGLRIPHNNIKFGSECGIEMKAIARPGAYIRTGRLYCDSIVQNLMRN